MFKRILFIMMLCLMPLSTSFASSFMSPDKPVLEKICIWNIEVIKQNEVKNDTLYYSSLRKNKDTIKQEDDTLVFFNKYFTIIEPSNENDDIVFRIHNLNIDNELYSENFTLNRNREKYILQTKYNDIIIKLIRQEKIFTNKLILY